MGARPAVLDALDPEAVAGVVAAAEPEVIVHELTALAAVDRRRFDRSFEQTNRGSARSRLPRTPPPAPRLAPEAVPGGTLARMLVKLLRLGAATVAVGTFAAPAAPSSAATTSQQLLARNRALWSAQHLQSYRFRLRITCDCTAAGRPQEITVRGGRPHGGSLFAGQLQTFPQMFRLIGQVLADPASEGATVRYDQRRGFPRLARLDAITWRVDRFQAL